MRHPSDATRRGRGRTRGHETLRESLAWSLSQRATRATRDKGTHAVSVIRTNNGVLRFTRFSFQSTSSCLGTVVQRLHKCYFSVSFNSWKAIDLGPGALPPVLGSHDSRASDRPSSDERECSRATISLTDSLKKPKTLSGRPTVE